MVTRHRRMRDNWPGWPSYVRTTLYTILYSSGIWTRHYLWGSTREQKTYGICYWAAVGILLSMLVMSIAGLVVAAIVLSLVCLVLMSIVLALCVPAHMTRGPDSPHGYA